MSDTDRDRIEALQATALLHRCSADTTYSGKTCVEKLHDPKVWSGMSVRSCCPACLLRLSLSQIERLEAALYDSNDNLEGAEAEARDAQAHLEEMKRERDISREIAARFITRELSDAEAAEAALTEAQAQIAELSRKP